MCGFDRSVGLEDSINRTNEMKTFGTSGLWKTIEISLDEFDCMMVLFIVNAILAQSLWAGSGSGGGFLIEV